MPANGEKARERLRSAAHDLRNLSYRLALLTQNLEKAMEPSAARAEAGDLLGDTRSRLDAIAEELRSLAVARAEEET